MLGAGLGVAFDAALAGNANLYGGLDGTVFNDSSTAVAGRIGVKGNF